MSFWKYARWLIAPLTSLVSVQRENEKKQKRDALIQAGYDPDQLNDDGSLWDSLEGMFGNASNKYLGTGLTDAEKQANEFSASEAQKGRDWEEYMSNTAYQRQVSDMKAAGVNPALAISSSGGASSPSSPAPSSVAPGAGMSMSELVSLMNLPLQRGILKAQKDNINADTEKKMAETEESKNRAENMRLVNQYYPAVTQANLDKVLSDIGVNSATIDQKEAETALTRVKEVLADKESKYADQFFKARAEYQEASTESAKAAAAASAARAAMDAFEKSFAESHGYALSSSGVMAIVSAVCEFIGGDEVSDPVKDAVSSAIKESFKPFGMFTEFGKKVKGWKPKLKSGFEQFEEWRNCPKRLF